MLYTPIFGLPYAEPTDPVREFPTTIDAPKTVSLETVLAKSSRDTGIRSVTSLFVNGWTGSVKVRRVGNLVEMVCESLVVPATWNATVINTPPAGFTATNSTRVMITFNEQTPTTHSTVTGMTYNTKFLTFSGTAPPAGNRLFAHVLFYTDDPWPTVLPGVPFP